MKIGTVQWAKFKICDLESNKPLANTAGERSRWVQSVKYPEFMYRIVNSQK